MYDIRVDRYSASAHGNPDVWNLRTSLVGASISTMRRLHAILALVAMLAAPLALLARAGACVHPCCEKLCCDSRQATATQESNTVGMMCHRHASAAAETCFVKSNCNHALEYGFASPLPPTVFFAADELRAPQVQPRTFSLIEFSPRDGFFPTPFEPPRS
jgi:hypothetical protein